MALFGGAKIRGEIEALQARADQQDAQQKAVIEQLHTALGDIRQRAERQDAELKRAIEELRGEISEVRRRVGRHDEQFRAAKGDIDRFGSAIASLESADELPRRLQAIEDAVEGERSLLEKAQVSLVRLDLELRASVETAEKTATALFERIQFLRPGAEAR